MDARFPAVPGVEHRFLDVGRLHVHVAEAGAGPPVLLLHGWPQHWYSWRRVVPLLAPHHRLIMPDMRGFGWTSVPPGGYDKETLASDALRLLDALELDRVLLIGHDWGGWAGFLACLRAPERFSHFVALNVAHPWPEVSLGAGGAVLRLWYQAVIAMPLLGRRVVAGGFVERGLAVDLVHPGAITPADARVYVDRLQGDRGRASELLYRTFLLRELGPLTAGRYRYRRLTVPTRLLFGERDIAISRKTLMGYEDHADDMEIELVPDSGHFIAEEKPELVAERALAFFARGHSVATLS